MIGISALLLAGGEGLRHSFETDHIAAVANLVTGRERTTHAIKDGVFWGIGHTAAIFFISIIILGFKMMISETHFSYLEALVGFMILGLGLYRLFCLFSKKQQPFGHTHQQQPGDGRKGHRVALGVGIIHGLAGSGAVVAGTLIVLDLFSAFAFITVFGIGSIIGMLVAAGLLSLPFSRKLHKLASARLALTVLSSLFCLYVGGRIIFENLMA